MDRIDWIRGDSLGLDFPAHGAALLAGGTDFLTRAFRATGALEEDNRVTRITESREISGGSTGRKLLLAVEYARPSAALHTDLFVKFSRDFDDRGRDRARIQMEREVLFALLSRCPEFPIAVPRCYFSDFHHASGTGILISQRIHFGAAGVEPHYPKCLDHRMPDQAGHYRALVRALGRLAGTHKAGHLPDTVEKHFPFEPASLAVSIREPCTPEEIGRRVAGYAEFATQYPQLLPAHIRSEEFLAQLAQQAPRFQARQDTVYRLLQSQPHMIALCHWNAHIDNAWFWRSDNGQLECGLMDWGNVSQMNVAMAMWGCLSGAEPEIWDLHLDELLALFASEFQRCGGPALDLAELKLHLAMYVAMMGLTWMLDAPRQTLLKIPDLAQATDRLDPRIQDNERARSQLLILIAFLNLWQRQDMAAVLDYIEAFA